MKEIETIMIIAQKGNDEAFSELLSLYKITFVYLKDVKCSISH